MSKKNINLRKTEVGKEFIAFLKKVGYSDESINKAFQNKLNPTLNQLRDWEDNFNIPRKAFENVKGYLSAELARRDKVSTQ